MLQRMQEDPEFLKSQLESRGKKVYLTGFGKFNGVEVNPTTILIDKLKECSGSGDDDEITYEVLEVAVDKVNSYLCSLPQEDALCFIHLGVNATGDCIQLERMAYNNMNFRCEDESGFQPKSTPICEELSLDGSIMSDLPLEEFATDMCNEGFNCKTSDDPGRFLCNYVYFKSLQNKKYSVFIHVPHFSVIDADTQLLFVKRITKKIVAFSKLMGAALGECDVGDGKPSIASLRDPITRLVSHI